jgi:hypothetical protein
MQADGSFFEQPRNKATKMAKLCSFVALLFNHSALRTRHSALERLFSGFHFGMDDWGGARASRLRVRASRPNHWSNHSVWETGFRRDAENGDRDGRAPHSNRSGVSAERRKL